MTQASSQRLALLAQCQAAEAMLSGEAPTAFVVDLVPAPVTPPPDLRPLAEIEKAAILSRLKHFSNVKAYAAKSLGVSVKTLYNKMHLYGIALR